jgi:hypothetical protein
MTCSPVKLKLNSAGLDGVLSQKTESYRTTALTNSNSVSGIEHWLFSYINFLKYPIWINVVTPHICGTAFLEFVCKSVSNITTYEHDDLSLSPISNSKFPLHRHSKTGCAAYYPRDIFLGLKRPRDHHSSSFRDNDENARSFTSAPPCLHCILFAVLARILGAVLFKYQFVEKGSHLIF